MSAPIDRAKVYRLNARAFALLAKAHRLHASAHESDHDLSDDARVNFAGRELALAEHYRELATGYLEMARDCDRSAT